YEATRKAEIARVQKEKHESDERHRQEQLAKETQDKIKSLKSKVANSESAGNLVDASKYVSEILSLDPQNSYAKEMRKKISEKAGLSETAPLKSRAEIAFDGLSSISSKHGFDVKITNVKAMLKTAETLFNSKSFGSAMTKYQEVITESEKLAKLDSARSSALNSNSNAAKSRSAAKSASSATLAKSIWTSAESLLSNGDKKLTESDFPGASKSFAAALKEYDHAKAYADGISAVNILKNQGTALVDNAKFTNAAECLDQYGGSEWKNAKLAVTRAKNAISSENWKKAISQYKKALLLMPKAIRKAKFGAELARKRKASSTAATAALKEATAKVAMAKDTSRSDESRRQAAQTALKNLSDLSIDLSPADKRRIAALRSEIAKLAATLKPPGPEKGDNWTVPGVG
ncbi:MAG: hypothetical protein KAG97_00175, partial [Victivallales bacterium]|nr:hypothetical protein [Victivallales bacterium]